jgi:RimJ/RimL family protein N-acetyltransferase
MNISFTPLKRNDAQEIVSWQYEAPYDIYNKGDESRDAAMEYLIDKKNFFFAVMSESSVVGFRSFGADGRVAGGEYDDSYMDTGGGLRPDLTGKGIGAGVVLKGLEFGSAEFGIERFRVTIASFNERAIKVCKKIGFKEDQIFRRPVDQEEFVVLKLDQLKRDIPPNR